MGKGNQAPFWQDYVKALVMMFIEPALGILYLYMLYRVLTLPAWGQVVVGLGVWVALGYGGYWLHQKMKKGLEKA